MIIHLRSLTRERLFDTEVGRFVEHEVIPCHRCGVCCERWQPLIAPAEIDRIAAALDLPVATVRERFTEPYPFDDRDRLLRHEGGGCVFLAREPDGRALCRIHPARPDACREWTASLARRECVRGLGRFGPAGGISSIADVYADAEERRAFVSVARGEEQE